MTSRDSQIDKPQRGRPNRAELPDANITTGAQSINTKRASLKQVLLCYSAYGDINIWSKIFYTFFSIAFHTHIRIYVVMIGN